MKLPELVAQIEKAHPALMKGLPPRKAAALIRAIFKEMNDTLALTEEGVVSFPGLGKFRMRQVQQVINGEAFNRTQIIFMRSAKI